MNAQARRLALFAVAVVPALAAYWTGGIASGSGVRAYLPDDVPAVKAWLDSLQRFDAFDSWLVGLEEPGPALSLDGLRHVDGVTRKLEALKASGVLAVRSVTNVQSLREGPDGTVEPELLVVALPTDATGLDALKQSILGDPQVLGALVSRDLKGYALVVRADPRKDPAAVARLIESTVEAERGPLQAHYYGAPFFAAVPMQRVAAQLSLLVPLFLALLFGVFILGARRSRPSAPGRLRGLSAPRALLCLATIFIGGLMASHARLLCTPQDMFSAQDEVGQSLAFFDERFGGADFIQIDFKGDLTDPSVAARLLRLTDLLEGSPGLSDVRSVAQILAFLNHGFGDAFRIPNSHAALANVWFFLEGNGDVRNLVTDKHDEAMIMIRVPSHPSHDIATLVASVNAAIASSADQGAATTAERLESIARVSGVQLDARRVAAVTAAAPQAAFGTGEAAIGAQVAARLRAILASPDSPYQPSAEELERLAAIVAGGPVDLRNRLAAAAASMDKLTAAGLDAKFVDMLMERERDVRLGVLSQLFAAKLWEGSAKVPEDFRLRAEGAIADLLDPQNDGGTAAINVGGLPVVAGAVTSSLKLRLWRTLALILGIGFVLSLLLGLRAGARGLLVATTATALAFIGCRAVGVEMDSGSATLYLLPALWGFVASGSRRWPSVLAIALAAALVVLLFTGALPVTRVAATASIGLGSVALVAWFLGDRNLG